jgi:hypothetical protein
MDLPFDIANSTSSAQAHYRRMVEAGQNPRFAEMCALQSPPGTQGTDRAFMEGRMNNQQLNDMPLRQAKYVAEEAKAAGINISGKYYCGGIANHRGWRDPKAWVSGNDDVLRVAKERQMMVTGSVNYDPGPAPPKRTLINESIVKDLVRREKKKNPGAKTAELREKVIEKHAYKVKNR